MKGINRAKYSWAAKFMHRKKINVMNNKKKYVLKKLVKRELKC